MAGSAVAATELAVRVAVCQGLFLCLSLTFSLSLSVPLSLCSSVSLLLDRDMRRESASGARGGPTVTRRSTAHATCTVGAAQVMRKSERGQSLRSQRLPLLQYQ